jgi:hypothetical protein
VRFTLLPGHRFDTIGMPPLILPCAPTKQTQASPPSSILPPPSSIHDESQQTLARCPVTKDNIDQVLDVDQKYGGVRGAQ